jgi:lipopolysaccharide/colanic/teichoic acid biosynthesis glycosyltransferase
MVALDVEYSRRRSLWLNLWILARTVPAVLSGRGAS